MGSEPGPSERQVTDESTEADNLGLQMLERTMKTEQICHVAPPRRQRENYIYSSHRGGGGGMATSRPPDQTAPTGKSPPKMPKSGSIAGPSLMQSEVSLNMGHRVDEMIKQNKVMIFNEGIAVQDYLYQKTKQKTVPNVFVNETHIGGCDATFLAKENGTLQMILDGQSYDFDLIIIGGGSGGLAMSKVGRFEHRRPGSGRRRVSTPEQNAALVAEAVRNPFQSASAIRTNSQFPGSTRTALRRLKDEQLFARIAAKKELLKDEHKLFRLAFAEEKSIATGIELYAQMR
ncbi:hypothetical protein C0J52_20910 [Blattella germanica]|nr:hypothetical protein C0J52_20910 [Blattella germanica]